MNYVKHFLKGQWLRKAAEYIVDPAKMKWLVGRVRQYCGKEGLAAVRDHLSLLADMASDITKGRYTDYSKGNFLLAVAALSGYIISRQIIYAESENRTTRSMPCSTSPRFSLNIEI